MPYLWHEQNKSTKETENMYSERNLSTWERNNGCERKSLTKKWFCQWPQWNVKRGND